MNYHRVFDRKKGIQASPFKGNHQKSFPYFKLRPFKAESIQNPKSKIQNRNDKFYRVPSQDLWKQSGTGLGLALVKKLVDYLKGSIRVESSNRQVSFMVELPFNYEKV